MTSSACIVVEAQTWVSRHGIAESKRCVGHVHFVGYSTYYTQQQTWSLAYGTLAEGLEQVSSEHARAWAPS